MHKLCLAKPQPWAAAAQQNSAQALSKQLAERRREGLRELGAPLTSQLPQSRGSAVGSSHPSPCKEEPVWSRQCFPQGQAEPRCLHFGPSQAA